MSNDNNHSTSTTNSQNNTYTPPKVWTQDKDSGGKFSSINRPTAGAP